MNIFLISLTSNRLICNLISTPLFSSYYIYELKNIKVHRDTFLM